ncbi:putative disease resistance protein, partial [Mucuna pruriens]
CVVEHGVNGRNNETDCVAEHGVNGSINDNGALTALLSELNELVSKLTRYFKSIKNLNCSLKTPHCVAEHGVNGTNNDNGSPTTLQSELNELVSKLIREEEYIRGQLQWLESRGKMCNKRSSTWKHWLVKVQDLKKRVVDMNNSLPRDGSTNLHQIQQLIDDMKWCMKRKPLVLPDEIVSEDFEENVCKMWNLLENDQVFVIGIHGMGGVGKTFLATYMENEIKRKGTFKHVFWVTVSHDFTIFKLQQRIAETMGVKLYGDDERIRATILESELEKIEKSVFILDDVWKYIDLEMLGIHFKVNGIKLIITSRLVHVCRQMDCLPDYMIQVQPLFSEEEEDWELFLLKLGHHGTPATLPLDVHDIARSVVWKCEGLPLGISVMARTMKGRKDIHWWRYANKFDIFQTGEEMKEEVLAVLKRSYDNLIEEDMQKCFLYCALLPSKVHLEDSDDLEDLDDDEIREWNIRVVESGLLNENRSLGEIFDEGRVILDQLIQHSLLLDTNRGFRMHGLVRRMACHILNQSHSCMVKCNKYVLKIPRVSKWTVDLEVVSLANSNIKEIPEGLSPNCPRLSTLILSHNRITHIPECFFTHMNALTLLDLSNNHLLTTLPNSLSKLRSLTSLVLRRCRSLEHIPPLGELQALSRLDISYCSIQQLPEGLGNLINLKWLDLHQHFSTRNIPGGILTHLTNMRYLDLRGWSGINVEDVQGMGMLECFGGSFLDGDNYDRFVREKQDNVCEPKTYLICFGIFWSWWNDVEEPIYFELNRRMVCFGDCEELCHLLPTDLVELCVFLNQQWECLCAALSFNSFSSLKNIVIHNCTELKSLFCLSSSCSLCTNIQMLESLHLKDLLSLTVILKENVGVSRSSIFSHLKRFEIKGCHKIEKLLTPVLVLQLQNLESITVEDCYSMKEIFAVSNSGGGDDHVIVYLPKLTRLYLSKLWQLKTVCKGILECGSENILTYDDCPDSAMHTRIRVAHCEILSDNINSALEREIGHLNQLVSDLICDEGDIKKQLQCLDSRGRKQKRHVDIWLIKKIKVHLGRMKGQGISIRCGSDSVQNNIISGSNNPHQSINAMTTLQGCNLCMPKELNELVSKLIREEEYIRGQLQWLESRGKMCNKRSSTWEHWLVKVQDLKKRVVDMNNSLPRDGSTNLHQIQQLIDDMKWCMRRKPLVLPDEIVGEDFEENVCKMWNLLENDQVFVIGIHGMGGVGKTFLATYMENEIKRKGTFKHVFWVTVSHDFSIFKLQQRIAETMGVKLYGDGERIRATILESELEKIEKSVFILDYVWKYIDLEMLGIHFKVNAIKLIITSRLVHVCRQMDCLPDYMIQVKPLFSNEDLELFLLKLGHLGTPVKLPSDLQVIARSIVGKCDGLPLGISVMARTMKEQKDMFVEMWSKCYLYK